MKEKQAVDAKPIAIYFAVQIIVGFIAGIIFEMLFGPKEIFNKMNDINGIVIFSTFSILAVIFVIIYRKRLLDDIKRLRKKDYLTIIVISICWLILSYLLESILSTLNVEMNNQNILNESLQASGILVVIAITLLAPFTEEVVFRYSISTMIKKDITFIIVSSIIFGSLHATNIALVLYSLMGAAFAIAYIKTDKNIIASTLVHVINNVAAVITMLLLIK